MPDDPQVARTLTRQQLYDLVWSTPMSKLAKSFGVSDVWLAKICKGVRVPTPPRGYWAKKRAGKRTQKRGLPRSADPEEVVVEVMPQQTKDESARELEDEPAREPPPPEPRDPDVEACLDRLRDAEPIEVIDAARRHPLVATTRRALKSGVREANFDQFGYVERPWAADRPPFRINVTEGQLDRAIRIVDALVKGFASHRFKTAVDGEGRSWGAKTTVLGEQFTFKIRERLRQRRFDPKKDPRHKHAWRDPKVVYESTGVLELHLSTADNGHVHRVFRDGKKGLLEAKLLEVITEVASLVHGLRRGREIARQRALHEQEQEAERQRDAEAKRLEERRVEALLKQAAEWERASRIRGFVDACRRASADSDGASAMEDWFRWAEDVAGRFDPLMRGVEGVRETVEAAGRSNW